MASTQAAVMVMDHIPDAEEVAELAALHLDDFPAEEAYAQCEITYEAPEWLTLAEQDQFNAHLRDGAACILIVYMQEGTCEDEDA